MANEKALLGFFSKIEGDVNGVIATAAVDLESGMTLAVKINRSIRGLRKCSRTQKDQKSFEVSPTKFTVTLAEQFTETGRCIVMEWVRKSARSSVLPIETVEILAQYAPRSAGVSH